MYGMGVTGEHFWMSSETRVTAQEVEHVATLARLELSSDQVEAFQGELNAIIGYFQALNELDTDDVPPTSHALALRNVFRADNVGESLSQEAALANAPKKAYGHFRVPKVIE